MTDPQDDRSSFARGMGWASRVTTIALEMVVPGLIGFWVDYHLGTKVLFLVLGLALGFGVALRQLVRLAKTTDGSRGASPESEQDHSQRE